MSILILKLLVIGKKKQPCYSAFMFDTKQLSKFPTKPGVYLMKNRLGKVLYVGKAKSLRQRVKQYFAKSGDGREMIPFLISHVHTIDTIVVSSEKEALILENNLIKKHKPKYNALLKDDKSYIALKMTKHEWPRVDIVRYRGKPKADGQYFGPYAHAYAARRTLDLLHRLFPLRQCSDKEFARRTRPCILYDMKRCVAPCVHYCTPEEYQELVDKTTQFLRGQDKEVLKTLKKEMHQYSEALEFEKAGELHKTIQQIEKTMEAQRVDQPLGVDADVLGIYREGDELILSILFIRAGRLSSSRYFNFSHIAQDDENLLKSFILQNYEHQQMIPHEILTPVPLDDAEMVSEIISTGKARTVKIYAPQRGNKKALMQMAYANAEATFKKEKDAKVIRERTLIEMQEKFRLNRFPQRIECFDNSNISGEEPVSAMVCFIDGKKESNEYRKYKVKTVDQIDDYATMREVLTRRYKRGRDENNLPDLLIVDGGKGHLNIALKVLKELNIISIEVIGLAKEEGRHDRGMTAEQVFLPNVKDPILLKRNSPILFLLQQIRDEAHRFAITFHRKRRSKKIISSALDSIPGIGPAKRKALLKYFGSVTKIKEASLEEITQVQGIGLKDAKTIKSYLKDEKGL